MMIRPLFLAALAATFATGCAAQPAHSAAAVTAPDAACVAPGTWYDPGSRATVTTQNLLARVKDASVVLLGETHVIADHHRWQLQTLTQLHAQRPDMVLGFEAFPRRVQPVLDAWVAGKLSEAEFLKQSEWSSVWKYDADLYLPMFHYARLNAVPMVALNVDRSLISKVSKDGWAGVPKDQRLGLSEPASPTDGYVAMLGESFGQHDNGHGEDNGAPKAPGLDDPRFAGFVAVQVTWDLAMSDAITDTLDGTQAQMVAIIGRGHMDYGYGVPHQLAARGIKDTVVLSPWDDMRPCSDLNAPDGQAVADAVFGVAITKDFFKESGPKLGVMIENNSDGGVRVVEVKKGTIAETSGILADDVITQAAGQPTTKTADLIAIVTAMTPGTWLPLTVQRGDAVLDIVARFPVPTHETDAHKDAAKP